MIQTSEWSPRFRWQLPFFAASCLASTASLFQFVPFAPTAAKIAVAAIFFSAALGGLIVSAINVPRERRLMRVRMTPREMTIMFPLYGLTVGVLTARVVLMLR